MRREKSRLLATLATHATGHVSDLHERRHQRPTNLRRTHRHAAAFATHASHAANLRRSQTCRSALLLRRCVASVGSPHTFSTPTRTPTQRVSTT